MLRMIECGSEQLGFRASLQPGYSFGILVNSGYRVSESSCNLLQVTPGRRGSRSVIPPESDKKESLQGRRRSTSLTSCTSRTISHKSARARAPARPACPALLAAAYNICSKISSFHAERISVRIVLLSSRCHRHVSGIG